MSLMEGGISARHPLRSTFEHAASSILDDAGALFAGRTSPDDVLVALAVDVGEGTAFRQDVNVTLGVPRSAEGEAWVPIAWKPAGHSHLLPSFEGVVEVVLGNSDAELWIVGYYPIPFGAVGRFGDGMLGRHLAVRSVQRLVEQMAEQLDDHVSENLAHTGFHPATYPIDLR